MTRLKPTLMCLVAQAALLTTAQAADLRIEGDNLENAKLVFDPSGVDRSTPEGTARGFLKVYMTIEDHPKIETTFERIEHEDAKKIMRPVFTPEAFDLEFARKTARMNEVLELLGSIKVDFSFDLRPDGVPHRLVFTATVKAKLPCKSCKGAGGDCRRCKGQGFRLREKSRRGKLELTNRDGVWLVKSMLRACWNCKGTGKPAPPKGAPDAPGREAPSSKPASCRSCKGGGYTPSSGFLRGPKLVEAPPSIEPPTPDLSSPRSAFAAYGAAFGLQRVRRRLLEGKLAEGFKAFQAFFVADPREQRTRKADLMKLELVKLDQVSETEATVTYRQVYRWSRKKKGAPADGKIGLTRGADGSWRVSTTYSKCFCQYKKADPPEVCKTCNGAGWIAKGRRRRK